MEREQIKAKIKETIASVTNLGLGEIADSAAYVEDLGLDSLSILEIVVEVEYLFQIKLPDEEALLIRTIDDTVDTVQKYLSAQVV